MCSQLTPNRSNAIRQLREDFQGPLCISTPSRRTCRFRDPGSGVKVAHGPRSSTKENRPWMVSVKISSPVATHCTAGCFSAAVYASGSRGSPQIQSLKLNGRRNPREGTGWKKREIISGYLYSFSLSDSQKKECWAVWQMYVML